MELKPVRQYLEDIGIKLTKEELIWFDEFVDGFKDLERYLLLYALCKYKKCKTAVEIGCAGGKGVKAMEKAGSTVMGVDIKPKCSGDHIFKMDSKLFLLDMLVLGTKFDLIFIDGSHEKQDVAIDIFLAMQLAKKYVLIHDYGLEDEVTEIVDRLIGKPKLLIQDNLNKLFVEEGIVIMKL